MDIADEMKEVYAVYCRNHDDAISLMEKVKLYINCTSSPHKGLLVLVVRALST